MLKHINASNLQHTLTHTAKYVRPPNSKHPTRLNDISKTCCSPSTKQKELAEHHYKFKQHPCPNPLAAFSSFQKWFEAGVLFYLFLFVPQITYGFSQWSMHPTPVAALPPEKAPLLPPLLPPATGPLSTCCSIAGRRTAVFRRSRGVGRRRCGIGSRVGLDFQVVS